MENAPPADLSLLLVRHAATDWTGSGRYQGRRDTALSAEGRVEAASLAARLCGQGIGTVIASPLTRAQQTAALIVAATGARLATDARLAELSYGAWEGLTQAEVKAAWPEELRAWKRSPATARPPGGETLAEAKARLTAALADLRHQASDGATVALVTHDILIRLALLAARGGDVRDIRAVRVPPASVHPARLRAGLLSLSEPRQPADV